MSRLEQKQLGPGMKIEEAWDGRAVVRKMSVPALLGILLLALVIPVARAQGEQTFGTWLPAFSEDGDGDGHGDFDAHPPQTREESARHPAAVNLMVVPDGRVLYLEQLRGTEDVDHAIAFEQPRSGNARTRLLDLSDYLTTGSLPPSPGAWSVPSPSDGGGGDFTGSEQRHLADGRVLVIGGTEWRNDDASLGVGFGRTELYGLKSARIFDPSTDTWEAAAAMHTGRYYPTLITLPNGKLLAAGGAERLIYNSALVPGAHPPANAFPQNVRSLEIYDAEDDQWSVDKRGSSRNSLPLFAHLHLLPNGKLLYPAAGMLYAPGGGDQESEGWNHHQVFDPETGKWEDLGVAITGVRSNGFSVLLPLKPPYDRAQILIAGGTVGPWPSGYQGTTLSELITWDEQSDSLRREFTSRLSEPRWHSSGIVLPSGEVIALSGADRDEVFAPGLSRAVRHAESFDPRTGEWSRLSPAARDRTLHNTAVLLPDGSILVGGHAPAPRGYGSHQTNPFPLASNFKEPAFEIFQPPYLFRGPRPTIAGLSEVALETGGSLTVDTPDATEATLQVVFSRLPATTHAIDSDQRTVVVDHDIVDADTFSLTLPHAAVIPPGPYYLFLLKDNGEGLTPSVASVVRVVTERCHPQDLTRCRGSEPPACPPPRSTCSPPPRSVAGDQRSGRR